MSGEPTSCTFNDLSQGCNSAVNGLQFRINFYDECMHKPKCSMWNFREKYLREGLQECTHNDSSLFVQYTCASDDEDLLARATYKYVIAGIDGLIMALLLLFVCIY